MRSPFIIVLLATFLGAVACKQLLNQSKGLTGTFIRNDTTAVYTLGDTITITEAVNDEERYDIVRKVGTDYFEADQPDLWGQDIYTGTKGKYDNVIDIEQTEWHWIIDIKLGILQSGKNIYFRKD